jgi:hypothetical protein
MTLPNSISSSQEWVHCYRMHPKWMALSIGVVLFCAAVPIVGTVLMICFAAPGEVLRGILMIWCLSACWGPFLAVGAYLFVSARRYRLLLGDDALCEQGAIKEKFVAVAEIQQLRWSSFPDGGSIVAVGLFGKIDISLMMLRTVDRPQVITWFREHIPAERQIGWSTFEEWILPSPAARRRWWWWTFAGYGVAAGILVIGWLTGLLSHEVISGIVICAVCGHIGRKFMSA